jgi:predicted lipoprotein with Yx(FWY)xxD motif
MEPRRFLTLLGGVALVLAACNGYDSPATGDTTAPTTSAAASATGQASESTGAATVMIAADPTLGDHLVDADGRTLYLFEKDEGTTTACSGGCADNWPPIVADATPTAGDGLDLALLATATGILPNQVTYNGHLLYYFAGDQAPGDVNGAGIPSWYAVDAAGTAIETG